MGTFNIDFRGVPHRRCRVEFGEGVFGRCAEWISKNLTARRLIIVSDSNVAGLYDDNLSAHLGKKNLKIHLLTFPPGEENKNWSTLGSLIKDSVAACIGRDGLVLALGGGVTGDIGGMLAALYCRGIPWIQVPTSTMAMADSAVGGKTAVNIGGVKNVAGVFHQPLAVFADVGTLKTLPSRHLRSGLAEIVKTALVADAELFALLEASPDLYSDPTSAGLASALYKAAKLKAEIVHRDELEGGEREVLNAGHTIGHALETAAGGRLLHGEAVAIGLVFESKMAGEITGFPKKELERLTALLDAFQLPTRLPEDLEFEDIIRAMNLDKKSRSGKVRFALPSSIGKIEPRGPKKSWSLEVDGSLIRDILCQV